MGKAIKKTIFELYEYADNNKCIRNVFSNIADIVLLLIYVALSFDNGIEKITSLQVFSASAMANTSQTPVATQLNILIESGVGSLVLLNLVVLMRNHINLHKKIKEYKESYRLEQEKRKRIFVVVRFPAWQICLHIVWAAYLGIGVVLLCVYITGNNVIHPLGLTAIATTVATLLTGLIADFENLFNLQPAAYERKGDRS